MLSIVIPSLNAEDCLAEALSALVPAVISGLVREVIIADGGSSDATERIADGMGAVLVKAERGRGTQLMAGGKAARGPWLLFLHADAVLEPGWEREVRAFIERTDSGRRPPSAAAFRFTLDDSGFRPRLLEQLVAMRCAMLRLPYGDQGLLISKQLYEQIGGFRAVPLMEDVDIVRRLGRRRVTLLRTRALTSARRYRREGYLLRPIRNLSCLALYYLKVSPTLIRRLYG